MADTESPPRAVATGSEDSRRIKVFCRIRPSANPSGLVSVDASRGELSWTLPPTASTDIVNNTRTSYKFAFDGILDDCCDQEAVFAALAHDAVDTVLGGVNATVFAYGQTGSGKTFTMTGGPERYADRGLIPRALSRLFDAVRAADAAGGETAHAVLVSYMEVYNETAYDLLDPAHEGKALEELPRVTLQEDEEGRVHARGLSCRPARNEEEALNLLFLGDTNRAVAETPMNMASSRSHCIFTVAVEARRTGSAVVRKSKLHLVDLAGSERAHKTQASGLLFREAAHINKSLHFLEMVIVALHDAARSGRTHIPYRNSVMTSVLRDSLGGNCVTSMVATLNPEAEHTDESLSTCRFAQRVARVTNVAVVNEEVEPQALIRILRARVGELEAEVAYLGHGEGGAAAGAAAPPDATLPADERDEIARAARAWVTSAASSAFPPAPLSLPRIKFALAALRDVARAALAEAAAVTSGSGGSALPVTPPRSRAEVVTADTAGDDGTGSGQADVMALRATVARLTEQLRTRDDELAAITSMVRATQLTLPTIDVGAPVVEAPPAGAENENSEARAPPAGDSRRRDPGSAPDNGRPPATSFRLPNGDTVDAAELESEAHALGVFTAAHPTREVFDDCRLRLQERYAAATAAAAAVTDGRAATARLRAALERRRIELAVSSVAAGRMPPLDDGGRRRGGAAGAATMSTMTTTAAAARRPSTATSEGGAAPDAVETRLLAELAEATTAGKVAFDTLRGLRSEADELQRTIAAGRLELRADFEAWWASGVAAAVAAAAPVPTPDDALAGTAATHPTQSFASSGAAFVAPLTTTAARDGNAVTGGVTLTGDAATDADILAFLRAQEALVRARASALAR